MQGQMASNDTHKQETKQRVAIGLKLYDAVEPSITMNPKTLEPQEPNPEPKPPTPWTALNPKPRTLNAMGRVALRTLPLRADGPI